MYNNVILNKRNKQLSYNKNNIKKLCGREDTISSCLGARQVRYAL